MRIALVLVIILLIAGCTPNDTPRDDTEIFEGSEGLVIDFTKDSPPETVFEDQPFPIAIGLENKGAYDIDAGYISIIKEDDYVDIDTWEGVSLTTSKLGSFSIEGKSKTNPEGGKSVAVIKMKAKELEPMAETHTVLNAINVCYVYKTFFGESVCIETDVFDMRQEDKPCESETITSSGQGAPVAITRVEPSMLSTSEGGVRPQFTIEIENVADGEIVAMDKVEAACTSEGFDRKDLNLVTIVNSRVANDELVCTPNPVRLDDGEGKTVCRLQEGASKQAGTYTSTLYLELEYGYTKTISGTTEIRRIT